MAVDLKYGRVSLENADIGEDEPVVVFRAKDELAVKVLEFYGELCRESGSPERHLNRLDENVRRFVAWQAENDTQTPGTSPFSQSV
jgi:hypothetical protein